MNSRIRQIVRLLAAFCCLLSTQWVSASSVTVVTHGADVWGFGGPLWDLGLGIYNYWADPAYPERGGAVEYTYNKTSLTLSVARGDPASANKIIVFDWAAESDRPQGGYDEAAGDALFAMLRANNLLQSDYLHLIGHSRGGIVSSEAAQRILHYGYDVDQLTLLDYEPGPVPYDDAGSARAWEGIRFVDNYYGTGGGIGLGGNSLTGAWNLYQPSVGHTSFPDWYTSTISTLDGDHPGYVFRVNESMWPDPQGSRTTIVAPPDVVNGDFEYGVREVPEIGTPAETSALIIAGWDYHGGAGLGHVDYIDLSDYDLELDAGNDWKRHNWLYAPEDAYKLVFKAKGEIAIVQSDQFWVRLRSQDNSVNSDHYIFSTTASTAAKGWQTYEIPLVEYADSVFNFMFDLSAPGTFNIIDSQVQVDDVHFLRFSPGDFNRDGVVDAADYVVWRKGLGTIYTPDDYSVWRAHFGQYAGSGSGTSDASIPEPAALSLTVLAGIGLALRWQKALIQRRSSRR